MWRAGLLDAPELRLPLVRLDENSQQKLDEVLRRAELLDTHTLSAPSSNWVKVRPSESCPRVSGQM